MNGVDDNYDVEASDNSNGCYRSYDQIFMLKISFDEYRYIALNVDLIYAYGGDHYSFNSINGYGATVHYIVNDFANDRPTTTFDPFAYMEANPEVAAAYQYDPTQAILHYITYGYYEGRATAPGIDPFSSNLAQKGIIIGGSINNFVPDIT